MSTLAVVRYNLERVLKWSLPPVSALLVCLLRILSPFVKVKFCPIVYTRIGHLVINTEIFLRRLRNGRLQQGFKYIGVSGKPCNSQVLTMIRRKLPVVESRLLSGIIKTAIFQRSPFFEDMPVVGNEWDELNNLPRVLDFTEEEKKRGAEELAKMGIGPGDWWVCFHNRDSAYLDTMHSYQNWDYHKYRDCSIANFVPAMKYISSLGGYAVRMGHCVSDVLDVGDDPKLIDYASRFRSDFMDVYLSAHCKFFVGNSSGLHVVPAISNIPIIITNTCLESVAYRSADLFIPKYIRGKPEGRVLTFGEIFEKNLGNWTEERREEGKLDLVENDAGEILSLVREMNDVLEGAYRYSSEDERLQKAYWSLVKPHHRCYGCPARIGRDFLAKNVGLLDGA